MRQLQRRLPGQLILVGIPVLLAFLAKKTANKERIQHVQNFLPNMHLPALSFLHFISNKIFTVCSLS